jgi:hypothetical protein
MKTRFFVNYEHPQLSKENISQNLIGNGIINNSSEKNIFIENQTNNLIKEQNLDFNFKNFLFLEKKVSENKILKEKVENLEEEIKILKQKVEIQNKGKNNIQFFSYQPLNKVSNFQKMEEKKNEEKIIKNNSIFYGNFRKWGDKTLKQQPLINGDNFKALEEEFQDFYLLSRMISQEIIGKNLVTHYNPPKKTIKKNLGVGSSRLRRLANDLWEDKQIKNFKKWLNNNGRIPDNKTEDDVVKEIRKFIINNYNIEPWPCQKCKGVNYLISEPVSLNQIYEKFKNYLKLSGKLPICLPTFLKYFYSTCSDIGLRNKRNDVCNTCTKFRNLLHGGTSVENKEKIYEEWKIHLEDANKRRKVYKEFCTDPPKNSLVISYDYKMNLALPHLLWQPNIIFYKRKKKILCFNIFNENKTNSDKKI